MKSRLFAGILTSILAGAFLNCSLGYLSEAWGNDFWYPFKVLALPGKEAYILHLGWHFKIIRRGILFHQMLWLGLGMLYALLIHNRPRSAWIPTAFTLGAVNWILFTTLFIRTSEEARGTHEPNFVFFPLHLVAGLFLALTPYLAEVLKKFRYFR